jgi:hypothetical protein
MAVPARRRDTSSGTRPAIVSATAATTAMARQRRERGAAAAGARCGERAGGASGGSGGRRQCDKVQRSTAAKPRRAGGCSRGFRGTGDGHKKTAAASLPRRFRQAAAAYWRLSIGTNGTFSGPV